MCSNCCTPNWKSEHAREVCTIYPPLLASFPVPRPAFRRLQYAKAGRAWYIFSREHDVIEKWQNFQNEDAAFCVLFSHLHVQRSVSMSRPPLAKYVWYVTWYLRSSCCSETHVRPRFLPVFLPLSTLDVTDVRRCTRPSPLYRTKQRRKAGRGTGYKATPLLPTPTHTSTQYTHFTLNFNNAAMELVICLVDEVAADYHEMRISRGCTREEFRQFGLRNFEVGSTSACRLP